MLVSWDDSLVDWASFSRVIISSTWDSVDRPVEYLAWVKRASAVVALHNPAQLVEWNLDKKYPRDLADAGIPVVPTTWLEPHGSWEPPSVEFVVKPAISAGSRGTARYSGEDVGQAIAHVRALHRVGQTVMVQDYLHAIDDEGELDLVFIDGGFSHAVGKGPTLQSGAKVVDRPWERTNWTGLTMPSHKQLSVAETVMKGISERLHQRTTCGAPRSLRM